MNNNLIKRFNGEVRDTLVVVVRELLNDILEDKGFDINETIFNNFDFRDKQWLSLATKINEELLYINNKDLIKWMDDLILNIIEVLPSPLHYEFYSQVIKRSIIGDKFLLLDLSKPILTEKQYHATLNTFLNKFI